MQLSQKIPFLKGFSTNFEMFLVIKLFIDQIIMECHFIKSKFILLVLQANSPDLLKYLLEKMVFKC